jgi:adenosylcobinamide-GDP ribazoletransferase
LTVSAFGTVAAFEALAVGGALSRLATTFCRSVFGGITGDTLGATNELIEVVFVLFMPLCITLA